MKKKLPRYPIYIPSKDRVKVNMTMSMLARDSVPYRLVVEPQEAKEYTKLYDEECVLILPKNNQGLVYARNWILSHSRANGDERHWQIDDNIRSFKRWHRGERVRCDASVAIRVCEDFTDRYENVAISGMNYTMFAVVKTPPFRINCHVYSCTLFMNSMPFEFRGPSNEDIDICLQVLAGGYCTIQLNAFLCEKIITMIMTGGNREEIYSVLDKRLKMSRALERRWPGVVRTERRFKRSQPVIKNSWTRFDTPLKLKQKFVLNNFKSNNYGLKLIQVDEIKGQEVKRYLLKNE